MNSTDDERDSGQAMPDPVFEIPTPQLDLDFHMTVSLLPRVSVGPTPFGHRNWITFTGGTFTGSFGSGTVCVSADL